MAKAEGADALDDPTLVDNYQYYHDPGVFSGHAIMVTQAFPLWGKRDLRKQAALADVEAARGREQAAQNELDERIKVAFARYYVAVGALAVDREVIALTESMRRAAAARYGAAAAISRPFFKRSARRRRHAPMSRGLRGIARRRGRSSTLWSRVVQRRPWPSPCACGRYRPAASR